MSIEKAIQNVASALTSTGFAFVRQGSDFEWDTIGTVTVSENSILIEYHDEVFTESLDATPAMIREAIELVRNQFYA